MSITTMANNEKNEVKMKISGRFDFDSHDDFGKVLEMTKSLPDANYVIDLSNVDDIDSSALGMLLLLRDALGGENARLTLVNCKKTVIEEFKVVNFDKMFSIS